MYEEKYFASTEGAQIHQERIETGAGIEATASDSKDTQRRSYPVLSTVASRVREVGS